MPGITYITFDGERRTIDVSVGMSVMRGAVANGVPGIDADCGGACACATCHVYVDPDWFARLPPMQAAEADMLSLLPERRETSRLSCQVDVTAALDGLVVTTPETQG